MTNTIKFGIFTTIVIGISTWLFIEANHELTLFSKIKADYVDKFGGEKRLGNLLEWIGKDNSKELEFEYKQLEKRAKMYLSSAYYFIGGIGLLLIGYVLLLQSTFPFQRSNNPFFATGILVVSAIGLILGVSIPMLEITALANNLNLNLLDSNLQDIPFLGLFMPDEKLELDQTFDGKMIFWYKSKSILELSISLLQQGNILVGLAVPTFSIIIPLFKLIGTGILIWKPKHNGNLGTILGKLSKWSMADVFIVAIVLSFASVNNMSEGIKLEAALLPGFYCFLAYCMLSIYSGRFLKKETLPAPFTT